MSAPGLSGANVFQENRTSHYSRGQRTPPVSGGVGLELAHRAGPDTKWYGKQRFCRQFPVTLIARQLRSGLWALFAVLAGSNFHAALFPRARAPIFSCPASGISTSVQ